MEDASDESAEAVLYVSTEASVGSVSTTSKHHAVLNFLVHSPRGLTILVSSVSVILLLMLGLAVYLCARCLRGRKNENSGTVYSTTSSVPALVFQEVTGRNSNKSKLDYTKAGVGTRRMIAHKNIITPERTIEFTVPTISLHAQAKSRESLLAFPSTSAVSSESGGSRVPMIETQFFPQFHLEDGTVAQVGFSLHYEVANQMLYIRILGGNNFPDDGELSYAVQVKIYPGRGTKQKTKEFLGPNPTYNQDFNFHVRGNVLQTKVLKLRVIGSTPGIINTKSLLGVVNMAMKDIPAVNHKDAPADFRTGEIWKRLEHPSSAGEGVRLDVSLKWTDEPNPGLLVLKIREAYGLHEIMEAEYTTTYVKVTLQEQGKSIKSRKTRLIRWGSLPNYDDTFVVTIPFELLSQISFNLTLIARGRLGSKVIVGKVNIGPIPYANPQSGSTSGNEIWEDMTHKPNVETSRWLHLLP